MSGGFDVDLAAVSGLADTVADQQKTVAELGEPMRARASRLNTGDDALDAASRVLAAEVNDMFGRFGAAFGAIARDLDTVSESFRSFDAQAAARYRDLADADPGATNG